MADPVNSTKTTTVPPPPGPLPRPNVTPPPASIRPASQSKKNKKIVAGVLGGTFLAAVLGGVAYLSRFDISKMNVRTPPKPVKVQRVNNGQELKYIHTKALQFVALDKDDAARKKLEDGLIEEQTVKAILSIKQLNPAIQVETLEKDRTIIHESYQAMFTKIDADRHLLLESDQQATKEGKLEQRKTIETQVLTDFDKVHDVVAPPPANGQGVVQFKGPTPKKFTDNFRH